MNVLMKHELLRVKMNDGCGYARKEGKQLLEGYLDCVCVHEIGFTLTLYREKGLPRPSNCNADAERYLQQIALEEEAKAAAAKTQPAGARGLLSPRPGSNSGTADGKDAITVVKVKPNSSKQQIAAHKRRRKTSKKPPPEFSVVQG